MNLPLEIIQLVGRTRKKRRSKRERKRANPGKARRRRQRNRGQRDCRKNKTNFRKSRKGRRPSKSKSCSAKGRRRGMHSKCDAFDGLRNRPMHAILHLCCVQLSLRQNNIRFSMYSVYIIYSIRICMYTILVIYRKIYMMQHMLWSMVHTQNECKPVCPFHLRPEQVFSWPSHVLRFQQVSNFFSITWL